MLADTLSRYWWTTLLRGIAWVLFGIVVFSWPGMTLLTLTLLFGGFVLIDGAALIVSAVGGRAQNERWWVLLLAGLAGIGAGILTFFNPAITALALLFCIGIWAITVGVFEVVAAIRLRQEISGEGWLVLAGLIAIAFGASLLLRPLQGALSVMWVIACYAIALGVAHMIFAFRSRGFVNRVVSTLRG